MDDTFYEKLVGRKEKLGKDISKLNAEQFEEYKEFLNRYNFSLSTKQDLFI